MLLYWKGSSFCELLLALQMQEGLYFNFPESERPGGVK